MFRRWKVHVSVVLFILLVASLSGCAGGGVRHESWPGSLVVEGTLYVANVDRVQAFVSESGGLLWEWYPGETPNAAATGFYATPVLDPERNLLVVTSLKGQKVYALQLGTTPGVVPGVAWIYPANEQNEIPVLGPILRALGLSGDREGAKGQYVGSGAVAGDRFIVGNGDGVVYALELATGKLAWSFQTQERVWAKPLVIEDMVYVASLDRTLYALSLDDGSLRWSFDAVGALASSPVVAGNSLWFGDFGDRIYQVDPTTGDLLWTFEQGVDWFWSTPVVDAESGRVYFADVSGHVYAIHVETHALIWEQTLEDVFRGAGVLSPDGETLFLPGHDTGMVYSLNTDTGDTIPRETPQNPGNLPGDLSSDGERLFAMPILTQDRVQAYDLEYGKLVWSYPSEEAE
ncbi:MAG: PQQ-like beta-propeller repeat protein [Anaerolineae bacterium]|nr:PQQ-like beta-propeller repeat protein [Anaerolineae bacterium]